MTQLADVGVYTQEPGGLHNMLSDTELDRVRRGYDRLVLEKGRRAGSRRTVWTEPWAVESLRRLVEDQGYSLSDVGLMLGVTRERIRQVANKHGIDHRRLGHGAAPRRWSDEAGMFVAVKADEYLAPIRARRKRKRKRARIERHKRKRIEHVETLRRLSERNGGPVKVTELLDDLGVSESAVTQYWGYRPGCPPDQHYLPSYTAAMRMLYRAAGVEMAPSSAHGDSIPRARGTGNHEYDALSRYRADAQVTWSELGASGLLGSQPSSWLRYRTHQRGYITEEERAEFKAAVDKVAQEKADG